MTQLLTLPGIAISLAMDALAVSIAIAIFLGETDNRQAFRVYFHFGLFQALFPVLGWLLGNTVNEQLLGYNRYVALGLLAFVGIRMIMEGIGEPEKVVKDPTKGLTMILLATSVSIDALAVGVSFSLLGLRIIYPAILIGLVTGALSYAGIQFGKRLGSRFGSRVSIAGGVVLLLIGLKIVFMN